MQEGEGGHFGIWLPVPLVGKLLESDCTYGFRMTDLGEGDLSLRVEACSELGLTGEVPACKQAFIFAML